MRRTLCLSIVAIATVLGVFVPASSARAVDAPPGPVVEIPDVPSRAVSTYGTTAGPLGDQTLVDLWRIMTRKGTPVLPDAPAPVTTAPKPLTGTQVLARSGAGAASVLTAVELGLAWGTNTGLVIYGAASGTDYQTALCTAPTWYQGVQGLINLGFTPDCEAAVPDPNVDAGGMATLSYGGSTAQLGAHVVYLGVGYYCVYAVGALPSGATWQTLDGSGPGTGWSAATSWPASGGNTFGLCNDLDRRKLLRDSLNGMRFVSTTGTVLASAGWLSDDPLRRARCTIGWEDGTTTTGTGIDYRESEGIPVSAAGLGCEQAFVSKPGAGPGLLPREVGIDSENDESGAITEIADFDVPDMSPDQRRALETGNGRGLVLEKVTGLTVSSCMTWAADCSGWWTATSSGTSPTVGSSTYRCSYGGAQIALVECGPYRHTFDTRTQTPTITDPSTGEEAEWSAQPSTGNSLNPGTGPGTGASPADSCFETGWAEVANPIDWVLVPVKCALVWAFVPRQSVIDASQGAIQDGIDDSVVGSVGAALATLGTAFDAGVGCGGLPIHLEAFGHTLVDSYLLASCDEPAAGIAATVRTILSFAIIGGGVLAFTRYLGALFGFQSFGRNRSDSGRGGPSFD